MASRRSRIKGIANIPQRRKPTSEESELKLKSEPLWAENKSEIKLETIEGTKKDEILTNNDALRSVSDNIGPSTVSEAPLNADKIKELSAEITKNLEPLEELDIDKTIKGKTSALKEIASVNSKPTTVFKRKFAKIPVSLNAIQRKKKSLENIEKSESNLDENSDSIKKNTIETDIISNKTEHYVYTENENILNVSNNDPRIEDIVIDPDLSKENIGNVFQKPTSLVINTPHSDCEYPLPPPSPSKANRRIKAIPRLAYRKTSFSASESEDESRKINRIRSDSVCSTASAVAESVTECFSPQRPKEMAAIQPKKSGYRSEQTRKLAEARRDYQKRFGTNKPERHRLRMMDLIFYNPDSNPMTSETNIKGEDDPEKSENVDDPTNVEEVVDDPADEEAGNSDEENAMPVPQIKISPSGEIILDEQSLVIERKEIQKQREELQNTKVVDADKLKTGYGIYKKHKRSKFWTQSETLHFYKALNTIGTDFMLMCELFPSRTRRDLKMKFKKEEKLNRHLIDRALMQPCSFDFEDLKNEIDLEAKELEEIKKQEIELRRQREQRIKEKEKIMIEKARKREAEMSVPKIYISKTKPVPPRVPEQPTPPHIPEERAVRNVKEEENGEKEHSTDHWTVEKPKKDNGRKPKPSKKRKKEKLSIKSYMSDSDADESDLATQSESDEDIILPHKPTRSGRMPKLTQRYENEPSTINSVMKRNKIPNHAKPENIEPGSIMIITENGPNGEPVYKIYMVTPEQTATPLDLDSDIVAKAIQLKKGVTAQNIMTISANVTDDDEEEMPVENNVTIPEDRNVITLKSSEENNLVSTDSDTEIPEENVTIAANEDATAYNGNEMTQGGCNIPLTVENNYSQTNIEHTYITVSEVVTEQIKGIGTGSVVCNEDNFMLVSNSDTEQSKEVKIIATEPVIGCDNVDDFVLPGNKGGSTEMVLEVNSDGMCLKVEDKSDNVRTDLGNLDEQKVTILADESVVSLRT